MVRTTVAQRVQQVSVASPLERLRRREGAEPHGAGRRLTWGLVVPDTSFLYRTKDCEGRGRGGAGVLPGQRVPRRHPLNV